MARSEEFDSGTGHKLTFDKNSKGSYNIGAECSCGEFAVSRSVQLRGNRTSTRDNIKWLHNEHKKGTLTPDATWHNPSAIRKRGESNT